MFIVEKAVAMFSMPHDWPPSSYSREIPPNTSHKSQSKQVRMWETKNT